MTRCASSGLLGLCREVTTCAVPIKERCECQRVREGVRTARERKRETEREQEVQRERRTICANDCFRITHIRNEESVRTNHSNRCCGPHTWVHAFRVHPASVILRKRYKQQ